ncbi:DUF624 domain-containing protein [Alkalibacterium sp. f15]|uniref:DUF624 domain-containing protein n=1 Tax=Alkalibacterium sp. f15 TaxID=3414029 RepID=UPI003BF8C24A
MPEKIMGFLEVGMYYIYLNVLWFIGVLTGLVFFGLIPSSLTVQMILADEDFYNRHQSLKAMTKQFVRLYKMNVKKYWKLSALYSVVIGFMVLNLNIVFKVEELNLLIYITVIYSVFTFVHVLFLLPVLQLTSGAVRDKIKLAIGAPFLNLKVTFFNLLLIFTVSVLVIFYPVGVVLIYPVGLLELTRRLNMFGLEEKRLIKFTE